MDPDWIRKIKNWSGSKVPGASTGLRSLILPFVQYRTRMVSILIANWCATLIMHCNRQEAARKKKQFLRNGTKILNFSLWSLMREECYLTSNGCFARVDQLCSINNHHCIEKRKKKNNQKSRLSAHEFSATLSEGTSTVGWS